MRVIAPIREVISIPKEPLWEPISLEIVEGLRKVKSKLMRMMIPTNWGRISPRKTSILTDGLSALLSQKVRSGLRSFTLQGIRLNNRNLQNKILVRGAYPLLKKTGLLLIILLFLLSYGLRWNATSRGKDTVEFTDYRVRSALDFAARDSSAKYVVKEGTPVKAWVSGSSDGYTVNAAFSLNDYAWLVMVKFDPAGNPVSCSTESWSAFTVSRYLCTLSFAMAGLWLAVTFIFPHFAVKCPDCTTNPLLPVVTEQHDTTIFAGGVDDEGFTLPPVVERAWICPRCGYTKVKYVVPEYYRPGLARSLADTGLPRLHPRELDRLERAFDKWTKDRKEMARFHSFEEWKAFFDDLKTREGEKRQFRFQ